MVDADEIYCFDMVWKIVTQLTILMVWYTAACGVTQWAADST